MVSTHNVSLQELYSNLDLQYLWLSNEIGFNQKGQNMLRDIKNITNELKQHIQAQASEIERGRKVVANNVRY